MQTARGLKVKWFCILLNREANTVKPVYKGQPTWNYKIDLCWQVTFVRSFRHYLSDFHRTN